MRKAGRFTAFLLVLTMILPFAACSGGTVTPATEPETTAPAEETAPAPINVKYDLVEYRINDIASDIRVLGERSRFEEDGLTADWPCSGFEIKFETEGTDFAFSLDTNYQNYIKVIVDGEPLSNRFALSTRSEKKVVVRNMEAGTHVVRVLKDGQVGTTAGNYCKFTAVHLVGDIVKADNEERPLFLEFIGDSIWCGAAPTATPPIPAITITRLPPPSPSRI